MATSGALGGFLSAMLQLRAQRLQEAEAKAKAQSELMSGIGKGLGSVMEGIGAGIKQGREDQMYNQLATEAFGKPVRRATSADQGIQSAADLAASRMPGALDSSAAFGPQFTGGKAGFEERMKLFELKDKINKEKALDAYRQAQLGIAAGHLAARQNEASRAARVADLTERNKAFNDTSDKFKEIYKNTSGYLKSAQGFADDARKAMLANNGEGDPVAWQAAKDELTRLNAVHAGLKLTVPALEPPPYVTPAMQRLLQDPQASAAQQLFATQQAGVTPQARHPVLPAELVNRGMQGVRLSPEEYQQAGMQAPPAPGATPMPSAAPGAAARPAPGVVPLARRNPQTGQISTFNHQTGKWEIK
jgi:hypothetical protein